MSIYTIIALVGIACWTYVLIKLLEESLLKEFEGLIAVILTTISVAGFLLATIDFFRKK